MGMYDQPKFGANIPFQLYTSILKNKFQLRVRWPHASYTERARLRSPCGQMNNLLLVIFNERQGEKMHIVNCILLNAKLERKVLRLLVLLKT